VLQASIGAESVSLQVVAPTLCVTIRERQSWLNHSGFCRSAKDGNEKPDKEDKRDDDCEGFAPLFFAEALLVAALALSLRQLIPFFEIECHGLFISLRGDVEAVKHISAAPRQ
jgi:hypothetical protein